jgi:YVTN family beta-propeller protein
MKRVIVCIALLGFMAIPFVLSAQPFMYVPRGEANDIVIIDLSTDQISGIIAELENSHGLSSSPNSDYLVAGSMQQSVDGEQGHASKPATVAETEHQAHHASDADISTEMPTSSFVSVVHPEHGHVMRRISVRGFTHHTAVSPDGKTAIAVHSGAGGISVIDFEKAQVTQTLQTGEFANYAVFSRDGKRLYVSNAQPGTISEIDAVDWTINRVIKVGKEPEHMVIAPDGSKLFVANVGEGSAVVVDLAAGAVTKTYETGAKPHGIDVSEDGHWLFVSSKGDGKLNRIDLTNDKIQTIDLQPVPYHLEYVDKIKKLYVSSRKEPKIWVLNPETLLLEKTIDLGEGVAHQMVIRGE